MRLWGNAAIAVALLGAALLAQSPAQPAYTVAGITVEGNRFTDARSIVTTSGLYLGETIAFPADENVQGAIRRLYERGLFSSVAIVAQNVAGSQLYLAIRVSEYLRLQAYSLEGNDEVSASDIKKKILLQPGDVVTDADLFNARQAILTLYADDGYLRADVTTTVKPADTAKGTENVFFHIVEGQEVKIGTIRFAGNNAFDQGTLRNQLDNTKEKSWWQFWRSSTFDKDKYADDKKSLIDFYHRKGFLDAQITKDSIYYTDGNSRLNILITLSEGRLFYIRNIAFVGNSAYPEQQLLDRLGFKKGDVYNTEKFDKNLRGNETQTDVSSLYLDYGYLAAQFNKEETRVPPDSMDITIHVTENNQYRVHEVVINGNTKTYDKVIRRELYTLPGSYFSRADIIRSIRQLAVLSYFDPQKLRPETRMVDASNVDIIYHVEERSSDTFNASLGYSGSFGFTASVGLSFNNFSIGSFLTDPFRYGAGQVLNFTYQRGTSGNTLNTFSLGFTEPWLWDTPTSVGFTLFDTHEIYSTFESARYGLSLSVGRRFRFPDDFTRGDWTLQAQRNDVSNGGSLYRNGLTDEVSITQVLSRSSIDNATFPTSGSRVAWLFEAAIPFDSSFVGFHKNTFTFEFFTPLLYGAAQNRLVLYSTAGYGFMKEFRSGNIIQPLDYFFMGGNGLTGIPTVPLRGYPDQSVGPVNAVGQTTGGEIYEKYGLELRFAVSLDPIPIYVLTFAEAGNVWADLRSVDPFGLKRSAGVGARLLINPIGLLGFDEGYGFDPVVPGGPASGWNFHFQFGKGF